MIPQTARRFSPIFVATITPSSIETKRSKTGADYLLCTGARFEREGREPQTRTAMAFGQSAQTVHDLLTPGEPCELAVQFDGGTIKIIGAPRPHQKVAADQAARSIHDVPEPKQLTLAYMDIDSYHNEEHRQAA